MNRRTLLTLLAVSLATCASPCFSATLKMPSASELSLEHGEPRNISVAVSHPDELTDQEYVVRTSPFDKITYPIGEYTAALFEKNLGLVFDSVETPKTRTAADHESLSATVSIESFEAVIPSPAYKPYTADVVYRVTVTDASGDTVFTATAVGSAQTSKGMMSGFKAKQLAAHAATEAMDEAMTEILESLAAAEELDAFENQ
jgi:hypothetical protein